MVELKIPFFTKSYFIDRLVNRRFECPANVDKRIRIFVAQHFATELPDVFSDAAIYCPIDCGRAVHRPIDGIIGDDAPPPSISSLNPFLNEMTAIYWVGKHYAEIGDPEYVGFMHYRRYLDWSPHLLKRRTVFAHLIVTKYTTRRFFVNYHGSKWLDLFLESFLAKFGKDEHASVNSFLDSHFFHKTNTFIAHKEVFFEYFGFIEKCLEICTRLIHEHMDELNAMPAVERRQFSYIMERMTGYWIWNERRKRTIKVISSRQRFFGIDNGMTKGI